MAVFNEALGPGSCIIQEGDHYYSRDAVIVSPGAGVSYPANKVLGKITLGAITTAAKSGGNTGNGTISAVTALAAGAKVGVYKLRFTAATTWNLVDPDGFEIGSGANSVANANDLAFTTTAGGTAFVAGDGFDITVAEGSGKFVEWNPSNVNGSQVVAGVLVYPITGETEVVVLRRHAQVKSLALDWFSGANPGNKTTGIAGLAALGIIAR